MAGGCDLWNGQLWKLDSVEQKVPEIDVGHTFAQAPWDVEGRHCQPNDIAMNASHGDSEFMTLPESSEKAARPHQPTLRACRTKKVGRKESQT